mmetsp:Transcript_8333/g.15211  ORF Transcript_8333/g.15211 Transcript_8333/m.15211 type:complete len:216 (+) Transcript_8333:51-698(+)
MKRANYISSRQDKLHTVQVYRTELQLWCSKSLFAHVTSLGRTAGPLWALCLKLLLEWCSAGLVRLVRWWGRRRRDQANRHLQLVLLASGPSSALLLPTCRGQGDHFECSELAGRWSMGQELPHQDQKGCSNQQMQDWVWVQPQMRSLPSPASCCLDLGVLLWRPVASSGLPLLVLGQKARASPSQHSKQWCWCQRTAVVRCRKKLVRQDQACRLP